MINKISLGCTGLYVPSLGQILSLVLYLFIYKQLRRLIVLLVYIKCLLSIDISHLEFIWKVISLVIGLMRL